VQKTKNHVAVRHNGASFTPYELAGIDDAASGAGKKGKIRVGVPFAYA